MHTRSQTSSLGTGTPRSHSHESEDEDLGDEKSDDEEYEDLMFLQTTTMIRRSEPGPSRMRRRTAIELDDDEDMREIVVDESAGAVRGEGETVREAWRQHFTKKQRLKTADKGEQVITLTSS